MNVTKLTAAFLAVLVVSAGAAGAVAALPGNGNAPDDAGADRAQDDADEHARNDGTDAENASDAGAEYADESASAENASENARAEDAPVDDDEAADASSDGSARAADERQGPPVDMPAGVPDHVAAVHQKILQKIEGDLADIGRAIGDIASGNDAGADADRSEDARPDDAGQSGSDERATPEQAGGDADATATPTPTAEA